MQKMSTIEMISSISRPRVLDGYTFLSVEEETEEKICEQYSRSEIVYTMISEKKDGRKHGKAKLIDEDGCVVGEYTYDHGSMTGKCVICNSHGVPQFEGQLKDGVKDGEFQEFDDLSNMISEGCYQNGTKLLYFEQLNEKPGYYIERSKEDLHEVAYTQYNYREKKKIGHCFILNSSGEVIQEVNLDNNGEVIRELHGSIMQVFENGKIIYEGGYEGDWKDGFKQHGKGKEYENGVLVFDGEFVNGKRNVIISKSTDRCYPGYFFEKALDGRLVSISRMKRGTMTKHGRSIAFSVHDGLPVSEKWYEDGKVKWERIRVNGDSISEMDRNGNVVYNGGFKFLNGEFLRWGEGKEYEGAKVVLYKGSFQNGLYDGKGVLYRNKQVYFNGIWKYGYPEGEGVLYEENYVVKLKGNWHLGYLNGIDYMTGMKKGAWSCFSDPRKIKVWIRSYWDREITVCSQYSIAFARSIEELSISDHSFNQSLNDISKLRITISRFSRLERIEIGNECFENVREFIINGLSSLKSVKIGEKCFRLNDCKKLSHERFDGLCRIANCPYLLNVEIGDYSFADFKSFKVSGLYSLQSVDFGRSCFVFANFILNSKFEQLLIECS